jgi:DNA-binding XRE family transcriptional regulator
MLSASQLRAARGLLDWTRADLAKAANISPETIKNIEHGTFRPQEATTEAIVRAFAAQNVAFTDSEGVKKVTNSIVTFEGKDGLVNFVDDLYEIAQTIQSKNGEKPIYGCNVNDTLFRQYLKDYTDTHVTRMTKIEGLELQVLLSQNTLSPFSQDYRNCRYLPEVAHSVPFYVYADRLAIINFEGDNAPKIVIIHSATVANAYRDQFRLMWKMSSEHPNKAKP